MISKVSKPVYAFLLNSLSGYAAILFSSSPLLGFAMLLTTFINPRAGFVGLMSVMASNLLANLLGVHEDRVKKGLYAFNGLLVGLSLSLHYNLSFSLFGILAISVVLLTFTTLASEALFGYFLGLPALSFPFVLTSMVVNFSIFNFSNFYPSEAAQFWADVYFPEVPYFVLLYLKSMGSIFFQTSPWAGLIIGLSLFIFSRLAFLLSVAGFSFGLIFHLSLGGSVLDIAPGSLGFNNILTNIAIGGVFLVPSTRTFLVAILASMVSSLLGSFTKIFLINFSMPVLALPFVTTTLLFLYGLKILSQKGMRVVDFPPGSPEENLAYFKTRLERFGDLGLEIRLPFNGKWRVSQGYNGQHTHKELWRESLDFMALGPDQQLYREPRLTREDYFTYGLPILAPADGVIVRVIEHLPDNLLGEMDTKNNWGNLVLIQHGPFLFSQLSHLKELSILVKEGDRVKMGTQVGLAGNSGRSDEPHLHLHFQRNPEVGSPTIPIPFTQLVKTNTTTEILFNHIPSKNDDVANLMADFNIRGFFNITPGTEYVLQATETHHQLGLETWTARVDFWGNRYLENEHGDRLFFSLSKDYFACHSYQGSKESFLYRYYLAAYRVPFSTQEAQWEDRLPTSLFFSPLVRFFLDLILPFTNQFSVRWVAELQRSPEGLILKSQIHFDKNRTKQLGSSQFLLTGEFPGQLVSENLGKNKLKLSGSTLSKI